MQFINLTPHAIHMNDGTTHTTSGTIARVSQKFGDANEHGICKQVFGEVENLPAPQEGITYIVSGFVLAACKDRQDVVAPATGHPNTERNEKGHIVSVPCFVTN